MIEKSEKKFCFCFLLSIQSVCLLGEFSPSLTVQRHCFSVCVLPGSDDYHRRLRRMADITVDIKCD